VACAHFVVMNTWSVSFSPSLVPYRSQPLTRYHRGYVNVFALFQTRYVDLLHRPPQDVAWIGSLQVFLIFFIGTLTGRATDAGYFRALLVCGSVLVVAGLLATAQATEYWHFLLAQGICVGLGYGCLFCPSMATLSTYFSKHRSIAIGIAACGTATGGLIFPPVVRQLLPTLGFAWSVRVLAFVTAATQALAVAGLRPRIPPRKSGSIVEWAAFKEGDYVFFAVGSFFVSLRSLFGAFRGLAAFIANAIMIGDVC
jgi:MFS family permease